MSVIGVNRFFSSEEYCIILNTYCQGFYHAFSDYIIFVFLNTSYRYVHQIQKLSKGFFKANISTHRLQKQKNRIYLIFPKIKKDYSN
jgi:hypothetical protein